MRNVLLGTSDGAKKIAEFLFERSLELGTPGVIRSKVGNFPLAWYDCARQGWWISSYGWDRKPPTKIAEDYRKVKPTQATKAASLRRAIRNLFRGKQRGPLVVEVPPRSFHTEYWCGKFVRAVLAHYGVAALIWRCNSCNKNHFDFAEPSSKEILWHELGKLLKVTPEQVLELENLERSFKRAVAKED